MVIALPLSLVLHHLCTLMSTHECPSCALEVDTRAEVCPYCHYEFPRQKPILKYGVVILALLLAWPVFKVIMLLFR